MTCDHPWAEGYLPPLGSGALWVDFHIHWLTVCSWFSRGPFVQCACLRKTEEYTGSHSCIIFKDLLSWPDNLMDRWRSLTPSGVRDPKNLRFFGEVAEHGWMRRIANPLYWYKPVPRVLRHRFQRCRIRHPDLMIGDDGESHNIEEHIWRGGRAWLNAADC